MASGIGAPTLGFALLAPLAAHTADFRVPSPEPAVHTASAGTQSNSTKKSARGGGYVSRGRPIQITADLGVTGDMQLPVIVASAFVSS